MEELWTAVCSNDMPTVEKYFSSGVAVNQRYPRFGVSHSLIMGAVRNGQIEIVRLLRSYGETVEDYEEDEYKRLIASLRREYYKPEIERLKRVDLPFNLIKCVLNMLTLHLRSCLDLMRLCEWFPFESVVYGE